MQLVLFIVEIIAMMLICDQCSVCFRNQLIEWIYWYKNDITLASRFLSSSYIVMATLNQTLLLTGSK